MKIKDDYLKRYRIVQTHNINIRLSDVITAILFCMFIILLLCLAGFFMLNMYYTGVRLVNILVSVCLISFSLMLSFDIGRIAISNFSIHPYFEVYHKTRGYFCIFRYTWDNFNNVVDIKTLDELNKFVSWLDGQTFSGCVKLIGTYVAGDGSQEIYDIVLKFSKKDDLLLTQLTWK